MEKLNLVGNWIKQNVAKLVMILMSLLIAYTMFLYFHARNLSATNAEQLVEANNHIAELSHTIQENATTASRLAEENATQMAQLEARNHDLSDIINSRNEQILSLTNVIANFRPIHIVADGSNGSTVTQTTQDARERVDFDQIHSDYLRVTGHTLTNPAYAEMDIQFTRPLGLTVVSTQDPDGQWRTYVESDYSDLQIGEIDASVNPHIAETSITERQHQSQWYDGFEAGIFGAVGTSGHSGQLGVEIGYDFGSVDINIMGSGVVLPTGGDVLIGLSAELHPFSL